MTDRRIGPFTTGIDNVSPDPLPWNALRIAIDVDIDRTGWLTSRPGQSLLASIEGLHSLWCGGDLLYGMRGAEMVRISPSGEQTVLMTMPTDAPVSWAKGPDRIYAAQPSFIAQVADTAGALGVDDATGCAVSPSSIGGLYAGRYHVAFSYVDARGAEGALCPLLHVAVPDGGGIQLSGIPWPSGAASAIVYRTSHNGEQMERCASIPAGMTSYLIGTGQLGALSTTMHMRRMIGGHICRWWRGRLLVARGDTLYYSDAYRTHLFRPASNWMRFPTRIRMMEPVEGGIWIATGSKVAFFAGTEPDKLVPQHTAAAAPFDGTSTVTDPTLFAAALELGQGPVAVWFGRRGFSIGTSDGRVLEPRSSVFQTAPAHGRGALLVHGRRLLALLV